jgi:hypothetical protein
VVKRIGAGTRSPQIEPASFEAGDVTATAGRTKIGFGTKLLSEYVEEIQLGEVDQIQTR